MVILGCSQLVIGGGADHDQTTVEGMCTCTCSENVAVQSGMNCLLQLVMQAGDPLSLYSVRT